MWIWRFYRCPSLTLCPLNHTGYSLCGLKAEMDLTWVVRQNPCTWHRRSHIFPPPTPLSTALLTSWCMLAKSSSSGGWPVQVGVETSLPCLLWLPPTQTRRRGRDSCCTAFEWVTSGGGREGKSLLLPRLVSHLRRRAWPVHTIEWVKQPESGVGAGGSAQHLCCFTYECWRSGTTWDMHISN